MTLDIGQLDAHGNGDAGVPRRRVRKSSTRERSTPRERFYSTRMFGVWLLSPDSHRRSAGSITAQPAACAKL